MSATPPLHTTSPELPPSYFSPHGWGIRDRTTHRLRPRELAETCLRVIAFYRGTRFPFSRSAYGQPWIATAP